MNEPLDEELMSEAELVKKTVKKLKTKSSFLDLLRWTDRFYKAYVHLGERNGHITEQMKTDAKAARMFLRRILLHHHLFLCYYHTQGEETNDHKNSNV